MFQVTINGKIENYEAGTPYLTIAKKHQAEYPQDIILVFVNGKLTELYKSLKKDCELKFVPQRTRLECRRTRGAPH